jgi:hypothetical protein
MTTANQMTSPIRVWVAQHRAELAERFGEEYGSQVQEWHDFAEAEYTRACATAQDSSGCAIGSKSVS